MGAVVGRHHLEGLAWPDVAERLRLEHDAARRAGARALDRLRAALEEEGLRADLAQAGNLPAQAVAERIRRLVSDFAPDPQADDMAVLAIRVTPGQ